MINEKKVKTNNGKSVAFVTLAVLAVLSAVFVILGVTGMKLDSAGLRRLLPWIPNLHEKSEWKQAVTPDINFGENDIYTFSAKNPEEINKVFDVLSKRVNLMRLPAVVKKTDNSVSVIAKKDSMDAQLLNILSNKGKFTFADSEGVDFLSSEHIVKAERMPADQNGRNWYLSFAFDEEGKKIFAEKSKELIGKTMQLKLNGEVISKANISEALLDGAASLPGFTAETSFIYSVFMKSGILPESTQLGEKQVGEPLFGRDALNRTVLVMCIFLVASIAILSIGFRFSGLAAAWTFVISFAAQWWFAALTKMDFSVSTLIAVVFLNILTMVSLILILNGMKKDIVEGNGVKQALRTSYKTKGKLALYVYAAVFSIVVVAMIIDDKQRLYNLLLQMLCVGTLISALSSYVFFRVVMNNKIRLFGDKARLFYQ